MENKIGSTRRDFLGKFGLGGLLIGHAFTRKTCLAETVRSPDTDRYQSTMITTNEWYGDTEERLDFPKDWFLDIRHMPGNSKPVLTASQIRERIRNPIGTKTLKEIADGKKTVAIQFDDISRATPVNVVIPYLVAELKEVGIKDENILFICGYGSHRALTQDEARAKLGDYIVDNYVWLNHNPVDNFEDFGVTERGTPVKINFDYCRADVKISISGVKKHGNPGYSGGSKAMVPGLSSLETIGYFHGVLPRDDPSSRKGIIYHNKSREDMDEIAARVGLDFTLQVLIDGKRQPIGLYAGHYRDAWLPAVEEANKNLGTELAKDSDIVVANAYARNYQDTCYNFCNYSVRDGGTCVLIWQFPLGKTCRHYWHERNRFDGKSFWETINERDPVRKAKEIIIYSDMAMKRDIYNIPSKKVNIVRSWDSVLELLQKEHGSSTTVTIYPYAGIQQEPIKLDKP